MCLRWRRGRDGSHRRIKFVRGVRLPASSLRAPWIGMPASRAWWAAWWSSSALWGGHFLSSMTMRAQAGGEPRRERSRPGPCTPFERIFLLPPEDARMKGRDDAAPGQRGLFWPTPSFLSSFGCDCALQLRGSWRCGIGVLRVRSLDTSARTDPGGALRSPLTCATPRVTGAAGTTRRGAKIQEFRMHEPRAEGSPFARGCSPYTTPSHLLG